MARRSSGATKRRESVPDLMRRHSSLLAALNGEGVREGRRSERRRSTADLEREFPNLRSSVRPSTCHSIAEEEAQSLSIEELEQLLDNCTKLTRGNQLTEGRLWGLALPQHMPDLVKQNADQALFNFQKVSFGLDAAVQIYSKRVDSMHNSALDTRSRLTHQQKHKQTVDGNDVDGSPVRRIRRHSDFGGDATLATNMDTINAKSEADDPLPMDPLFHKTSALFDAGGYKGLPTLNLGIKKGGRYVLDTTEIPGKETYRECELPLGHKLNLTDFGVKFEPTTEIKALAPSTAKLLAMIDKPGHSQSIRELIQRGMNAVTLPPRQLQEEENGYMDGIHEDMGLNQDPQIDAASCVQMEMQDDVGFPEDDHPEPVWHDTDNGVTGYDHQEGLEFPSLVDMSHGPLNFTPDVADALNCGGLTEEVEVLDAETISWLLDPKHDKGTNRSRAWTGASHWKYPQTSIRPEAEREADQQTRHSCAHRETKAFIDFANLPDTDLSKFKKTDKESSITMQLRDSTPYLLPFDHQFDVPHYRWALALLQLPLLPSLTPQDWLWRFQRVKQQSSTKDAAMWDVDGNDVDMGMDGWGDQQEESLLDFNLIQAPPSIDEDNIQIEAAPNRIDMDMLKGKIWSEVEKWDQKEIPLNGLMRAVSEGLDVSFGICFACSLHLAIEHGFHLINDAEGHVIVSLK